MPDMLDSFPYAEKQKRAEKIAKHLVRSNDLGREVELEVIDEDDKVLGDLVRNEMSKLQDAHQNSSVKLVQNREDLEKLPDGAKTAIKEMLDQMGGQMPPGGLFQVKMDSVKGLDAAVDTIITNGAINLSSLVVSRLAAVRATAIASAIEGLVTRSHNLQESMPKLRGATKAAATAILKRIDEAILVTFGEHNYDAAVKLNKELSEKKPRKNK